MQTGYYNAIGGMVTQFNKLDVLSNNLANLNTTGFKQDKTIVADYMRLYQEKRDELPHPNNTKEASKFLNRSLVRVPQVSEIYTDLKIGALKETQAPLDLAISKKDLFLAVKVGDKMQLSRSGVLSIDGNGMLTNQRGDFILNKKQQPIQLDTNKNITIDKDGVIYLDNAYVDELMVAYVDNPRKLTKSGNSQFDTNGQTIKHFESANALHQGYLEQSNVNPVRAMTDLIATNRLLEMSQKVASSQMDDMNNEAINKIAVNK